MDGLEIAVLGSAIRSVGDRSDFISFVPCSLNQMSPGATLGPTRPALSFLGMMIMRFQLNLSCDFTNRKLRAHILVIKCQVFFEQVGNRQIIWALLLAITAFNALLYAFHGLSDPTLDTFPR